MKSFIPPDETSNNNLLRESAPLKISGLSSKNVMRRCACEKGTSLVEFTVCVPVLFMLLLGFCQMCLAIYSNFCVCETARDTVRWASLRGSNSCADAPQMIDCDATADDITSYAKSIGYPGITSSKLSVSTTWLQASSATPGTWSTCSGSQTICDAPGNAVQVVVSYPLPFQIPFSSSKTLNLSSTAQMVVMQ